MARGKFFPTARVERELWWGGTSLQVNSVRTPVRVGALTLWPLMSVYESLLKTHTPGAVLSARHCSGENSWPTPALQELVKWCRQTPV